MASPTSATAVKPCCFGHITFQYDSPQSVLFTRETFEFLVKVLKDEQQSFIGSFFNTRTKQSATYLFCFTAHKSIKGILRTVFTEKEDRINKFIISQSKNDKNYSELEGSQCQQNSEVYTLLDSNTQKANDSTPSPIEKQNSAHKASAIELKDINKVFKWTVRLEKEHQTVISFLNEDLDSLAYLHEGARDDQYEWIKQALSHFKKRGVQKPLLINNGYGCNALYLAIINDNAKIVSQLYGETIQQAKLHDRSFDTQVKWYIDLLSSAIYYGCINALKELKKLDGTNGLGSVFTSQEIYSQPLIGKAALHKQKYKKLVEYLISNCGLSIDKPDTGTGITPLLYVLIRSNDISPVKFLVEKCNADITKADDTLENTPLHVACAMRKASFIKYLYHKNKRLGLYLNHKNQQPFEVDPDEVLTSASRPKNLIPKQKFVYELMVDNETEIAIKFLKPELDKIESYRNLECIEKSVTEVVEYALLIDDRNVFLNLLNIIFKNCVNKESQAHIFKGDKRGNNQDQLTDKQKNLWTSILGYSFYKACEAGATKTVTYLAKHTQTKDFFVSEICLYTEHGQKHICNQLDMAASCSKCPEKMLNLLKHLGFNFNHDNDGTKCTSIMRLLTIKPNIEAVTWLVKYSGIDLLAEDQIGSNILHYAFRHCATPDEINILMYLLNSDEIDVMSLLKKKNDNQFFPIYCACLEFCGLVEIRGDTENTPFQGEWLYWGGMYSTVVMSNGHKRFYLFRVDKNKIPMVAEFNPFIKRLVIEACEPFLTDDDRANETIQLLLRYSNFVKEFCELANNINDVDQCENIKAALEKLKQLSNPEETLLFTNFMEQEIERSELKIKLNQKESVHYELYVELLSSLVIECDGFVDIGNTQNKVTEGTVTTTVNTEMQELDELVERTVTTTVNTEMQELDELVERTVTTTVNTEMQELDKLTEATVTTLVNSDTQEFDEVRERIVTMSVNTDTQQTDEHTINEQLRDAYSSRLTVSPKVQVDPVQARIARDELKKPFMDIEAHYNKCRNETPPTPKELERLHADEL